MVNKMETQVVVISAGTAGLAAAVAAAEGGASVIAFEKGHRAGGTGMFALGLFAVESRLQMAKQLTLTKEEAFKIHMDSTQWRIDGRLVKTYYDKSASTIDWLENMGVEFFDVLPHNPGYNRTWHVVKSPTNNYQKSGLAAPMMNILSDRAKALGVQIFLKSPVKKILKEDNRIVGVLAENKSGKSIQVNAKAVIVATGGYGGCFGRMLNTLDGDGMRMAEEVGADTIDIQREDGIADLRTRRTPIDMVFQQPALMVNLSGERFMNEELMLTSIYYENAIARQKDGTMFTILDQDTKNYYVEKSLDFIPDAFNPITKVSNFDDELKRILNEDSTEIFMADSIDELANKTGIDTNGLKKTIDEYNKACETGRDDIFNKKARYLRPVKTPKFYARRRTGQAPRSWPGIRINYKTEVLTTDYNVISGLFAAGTDAMCNIYSDIYPLSLPGNALGFCINSGRMAAESAIEYIKSIQ